MKHFSHKLMLVAGMVMMLVAMASCNKDEDNNNNNTTEKITASIALNSTMSGNLGEVLAYYADLSYDCPEGHIAAYQNIMVDSSLSIKNINCPCTLTVNFHLRQIVEGNADSIYSGQALCQAACSTTTGKYDLYQNNAIADSLNADDLSGFCEAFSGTVVYSVDANGNITKSKRIK